MSEAQGPEIFISAGELSGDLIGSLLVKQLRKLDPTARFTALGGDQMTAAGVDVRVNLVKDLAIIGFTEVVAKYPKIRRVFYDTVDYLKKNRPAVLVLIDYPGFNLRLAEEAHKLGIKVVYYVCPQVWAWHRSRVKKIRKFVDKALVILPFEEQFMRNNGVEAEFVGTPWLDIMILTMSRDEVFDHFGFDKSKRLIGLLPGSRRKEVESLLPVMLEAAEMIQAQYPDVQFVIPRATTVKPELLDHLLTMAQVEVKIVDAFRYNVRGAMDLAIVASGTATLETGLLGCPMAIIYKVGYLSWLIGKSIVNIPHIGLINLVAGDMIVPELVQDQCTPQNIADFALKMLKDPSEIERIKYQLEKVKEKMGGAGASRRAAERVHEVIHGNVIEVAAPEKESSEAGA